MALDAKALALMILKSKRPPIEEEVESLDDLDAFEDVDDEPVESEEKPDILARVMSKRHIK